MTISPREARLKMLRMRSWRRGMKEMDLILGPFADRHLANLTDADLDAYDRVLGENDQDLYLWVTGAQPCPDRLAAFITRIATDAGVRERAAH